MKLVDAHTHIDFYDNPSDIITQYNDLSILTIFMTYLPEIFEKHKNAPLDTKYIRLALGYHPAMVLNYDFRKDIFIENLSQTNYIGEIGLDYSVTKDKIFIEKQRAIFDFITSKTNLDKILSIHSRKAEFDVFNILTRNNVKNAIFHWYTGPISLVKDIIDQGYFFSVNVQMLKSKKGQKIINHIPIDSLLIESDGPFTKFNNKTTSPSNIFDIYKCFSDFYQIKNIEAIVYNNFIRLLQRRAIYSCKSA